MRVSRYLNNLFNGLFMQIAKGFHDQGKLAKQPHSPSHKPRPRRRRYVQVQPGAYKNIISLISTPLYIYPFKVSSNRKLCRQYSITGWRESTTFNFNNLAK